MISSGNPSNTTFFGRSTDIKPTVASSVPFASKFYELDTGHTYLWIGQPAIGWVEYLVNDPAGRYT